MDQKKRVPVLIEANKDSPFRILDVRSIQDNEATSDYTLQSEDAADDASNDSSGSEQELVIDMENEEPDTVEYDQDNPEAEVPILAQELEIESKMITPQTPALSPKAVPEVRTNRRKAQLVRMDEEDADVVYDAPIVAAAPAATENEGIQAGVEANRHIMRHIAMLRTTINCLVEARYHQRIPFPKETSDFETMDSWMDTYEQMKWDTSVSRKSKSKMAKKS